MKVVAGFLLGVGLGIAAERRWLRPRLTPRVTGYVMPDRVMAPGPSSEQSGEQAGGPPGELREGVEGREVVVNGPDGTQLAVTVHGDATEGDPTEGDPTEGDPSMRTGAPTLLAVHGWRCDVRTWHNQVTALAPYRRVVALDLPGHGHSSVPASGHYSIDLLGDAVAAVVDGVVDDDARIVLVGHSLGGMSILNAVSRYPHVAARVAVVVLVSTTSRADIGRLVDDPIGSRQRSFERWWGIGTLSRLDRLVNRLEPVMRDGLAERAVELVTRSPTDLYRLLIRSMGLGPHVSDEVVSFTEHLLLDADPQVLVRLIAAIATLDEDAGLDVLRRAQVPITVVVGSHDRITPPRWSRRMAQLTGAELVELADVGHFLPVEAPDVLNEILGRHLLVDLAQSDTGGES
ncbi:MAG: alpha/beta hydrolase [Nitriliruptoraceae bacterium]